MAQPTSADLELRASRIADPGIDLKTKHTVACELRDMVDTVKDSETPRVIPIVMTVVVDRLKDMDPSFQKDTIEHAFRRVLIEILHRLPLVDTIRTQAAQFCAGLLHVLATDTEENAITCCKLLMEVVRNFRPLNEELVGQFFSVLHTILRNIPVLVEELLSEGSPVVDPNAVTSSVRSFKVFAEMATLVVILLQNHRQLVSPIVHESLQLHFEAMSVQSPAQRKAREDYGAMGGYWAGVAPTIHNLQAYTDLIIAQVKMVSFLMFFIRSISGNNADQVSMDNELEQLILGTLRLLQDTPSGSISPRKDLMIVFRYLVGTPQRRVLLPHIDKLLDERVLLGTSLSSQETVRSNALGCIADLMHHLRNELSPPQLTKACSSFLRHLHNPYLSNSMHMVSARMLYNMVDVVVQKDDQQSAGKLLSMLLKGCIDKIESMALVLKEVTAKIERANAAKAENKGDVKADAKADVKMDGKAETKPEPKVTTKPEKEEGDVADISFVEKARPIASATYAVEKPEELIIEYRSLFRHMLSAVRTILVALKKRDAPVPDGILISRLFESSVNCMPLYDADPREGVEVMDYVCTILAETNLHVFQEVWTSKMDFMNAAVQKRPNLMHIANSLFQRDGHSPTLVAIVLRFCLSHLEQLGEMEDQQAAITIKWFKTVFIAVTVQAKSNEPILAMHVAKLIMDCFPLAARASRPTHYWHLLRALFRAIGGGGGRFEALYQEVLPLLPDMLECLNRQLQACDGFSRDMIVELCLTVPLRLTHLLPYLSYLMQPLALALRGNPELASQGLRTLELCIDNLTPDFLDPTLGPVLRDLMQALHSHLRPLPANHHHSHTTIRILGKLGGRNRRLLDKEPVFHYFEQPETTVVRLSLGGMPATVEISAGLHVASLALKGGKAFVAYRVHAFAYVESVCRLLLHEGVRGKDREALLTRCLEAAFDCIHLPEVEEAAETFIQNVARYIFNSEIRRPPPKEMISRRLPPPGPLLTCLLDSFAYGFARTSNVEMKKTHEIFQSLVKDLLGMATSPDAGPVDIRPTFAHLGSSLITRCVDELWVSKSAGCKGIQFMCTQPGLGVRWVTENISNIVRVLLLILKDMPYDLPEQVREVTETMDQALRVAHTELSSADEPSQAARTTIMHLTSMCFAEVSGQHALVRTAAQHCIALLSELTGISKSELLMPHRERMLTAIYTKPLRALPFPAQIGMVEGIRYCLSLDPPLPEMSEELLRLLHEALALADAEDSNLAGGSKHPRHVNAEVTKLRLACIKLLIASMPMTDFFAKYNTTRQRVTAVYFKSLYSSVPEIKDVAHEGLRMVLKHQSRLPKELLQTGLRPILMNLADSKRLSLSGLEALARLLELLTNYFKVEIGHKLLDHYRIIADPQMLQQSSRLPLSDNDGIQKLVQLANIFHLLPSAANMFLENLVNNIVQTEAQMHFSGQSPFSEPLAKYLDRYPVEAVEFFMKHLQFPRHLRTLRSILQARLAPQVLRELVTRTPAIVSLCLESREPNSILAGLHLCQDIAELVPGWLIENDYVVQALLVLWRHEAPSLDTSITSQSESYQRYSLLLGIFMGALKQTPRVDLIFEIVAIFTRNLPLDPIEISQFLYRHVALNPSLTYRRNVLLRFLLWFEDGNYPWTHKTFALRYIVTPTILAQAASTPKEGLLDPDMIQWFHGHIWVPMNDNVTFAGADDMFRIELLHFTTTMVQHYPELLAEPRKDIIKCAWHHITSEDAIVKHTAYLLAARFFDAWEGPPKFLLTVWTGLLSRPHAEGKALVRQALDILAPVLQRTQHTEPGFPQWAKTTRRLLAEESGGWSQVGLVYQLMARQSALFYPVRALFIPHVVNSMNKLGLSTTSSIESRLLSLEVLQVIAEWERQAASSSDDMQVDGAEPTWTTPLPFRESMVSYLVRLATSLVDQQSKTLVVPKALTLLRTLVGPTGWTDVTVKLPYFARSLQQNDLTSESTISQASSAAKVLQIVANEKPDSWFIENTEILTKLVRKGMMTDDAALQDSLHPIIERLLQIYPLPKEDDDSNAELSDFFSWVHTTIGETLRNGNSVRGALLLLKSVVQVVPERVQPYALSLAKLLAIRSKEHGQSSATTHAHDISVRLIITMIEICKMSIAFLGDQRRTLFQCLATLVAKSKNMALCRFILDLGREWALNPRETIPTMKEKAALLQGMASFENRERGDALMQSYLDLIYEIYTEPSLRRSDLTARLEQQFLLGCRAADAATREKFVDLLDASIPRSLFSRLTYIFGVQNWEALSDRNWTYLALHLLLGCVDADSLLSPDRKTTLDVTVPIPPSLPLGRATSVTRPLQRLMYLDPRRAHDAWVSIFPSAWACLSRREQVDLTHHIISLLSKEYHIAQAEVRPNVIQTLLSGIYQCSPPIMLPPHLVKYLAKTFAAWQVSIQILEASLDQVRDDEVIVRDTVYDALAEVYAELAEDDLFYGLWRRRSLYPDTNAALAFEQSGMWEQASTMYEVAQTKSRSGLIPFSEPEYCLWEDHWILAAEKLQQWDTLWELARSENNVELQLESAWRNKDWFEQKEAMEELIKELPEVATPRRLVFEAFISLLKNPGLVDKNIEFTSKLENAMQMSLRKWISLPYHLSPAHVPLLQHFQQFVELQEAVQIFGSLAATNATNLEKRSSDLKLVLTAWRERLPNLWDDISIWSDLVAWRQNVFNAINKTYIPLLSATTQTGNQAGTTNTYGYRGYHETAWIINRFAHVARKHGLLEVCVTSLNKIYTLPNIEISEAFLKLREQARCHYQKPNETGAGLEVINNTNLMYFSTPQKAEFYTLKGMFYEKLDRHQEAESAYGSAVQMDMNQAKAWAAWGKYNDRVFTDHPTNMTAAAQAVNCYLQAAGLYKNRKSRPLLIRVLWLLSIDDSNLIISRAFDTYKGEAAWWYWITLIPQLCLSISHREVKQARYILFNIAKHYPQALFFNLRVQKEELYQVHRQQQEQAAKARANQVKTQPQTPPPLVGQTDTSQDGTSDGAADASRQASSSAEDASQQAQAIRGNPNGMRPDVKPKFASQGYEVADEVGQIMKTAFPLLIMSLETISDTLLSKFKPSNEEETYRLISLLMSEALNQYGMRFIHPEDTLTVTNDMLRHLIRLATSQGHGITKAEIEEEFIKNRPNLPEYCRRLQQYRDRFEKFLDSRPRVQSLDHISLYLIEYPHGKYDDIEIPGQYTEEKDNNQAFVKLQKFGPKFENCRTQGYCFKRFTMYGHDSSRTTFAVQMPTARHWRREERVFQALRMFNGTLSRKKESQKRRLRFHVPVAVPVHSSMRLMQTDSSYVSMGDIYEQFCTENGIAREDPFYMIPDKLRTINATYKQANGQYPSAAQRCNAKKEILDEVRAKMIPEDTLTRYFMRTMDTPTELWRMRREFSLQVASTSFMTYILALSARTPNRFQISRSSGQILLTEVLPGVQSLQSTQQPVIGSADTVPFRFTPNMQHFMGPIHTEGLLVAGIMAIGRGLTDPDHNLDQQLCLFARDEVIGWLHTCDRPWTHDLSFRINVATLSNDLVKRIETLACKRERDEVMNTQSLQSGNAAPVYKTITNLVLTATNPVALAQMADQFMAWF